MSNFFSFTSEAKAFESLKTATASSAAGEEETVSFNTTKEECDKVCKSQKLADICQNGATCKTKSGLFIQKVLKLYRFKEPLSYS